MGCAFVVNPKNSVPSYINVFLKKCYAMLKEK